MKIRGKIVEGLGEGRRFTLLPWVRDQMILKLRFDPFPGTLNLEISGPENLDCLRLLRSTEGIQILPADSSFCRGKCYPALIGGRLRGAIVVPDVPDYPMNKIELVSPENIRKALFLDTGDFLEVEILLGASKT